MKHLLFDKSAIFSLEPLLYILGKVFIYEEKEVSLEKKKLLVTFLTLKSTKLNT